MTLLNVPGVGSTLVASEVDEGELSKQRLPSLVLAEDDLHNVVVIAIVIIIVIVIVLAEDDLHNLDCK